MFDIVYLMRRGFHGMKRYPRFWLTVAFLLTFVLGIWTGRAARFSQLKQYVTSYLDFSRRDVTQRIAPGIVHRQMQHRGVLTNVLEMSPAAVEIRPYRALEAGIGTETLRSLARRHKALAAINGGYFEMVGTFRGESVGALKIDGEWHSEPEQGRAVIGFRTVNGKLETSIDRIVLKIEFILPNGERFRVDGLNRSRGRNELVLYRSDFHSVTLTMPNGVEVVVKNGEIAGIYDRTGSLRIPADGYILSASGKKREVLLANLAVGDAVQIRETVIPERVGDSALWESCEHIIGGGPLLLRDGIASSTRAYQAEGFDKAFHSFWHPRTAIGKKVDGTLLFVTITAVDAGVRRGVTLPRLAELFAEWGATDALNLDGGSSSMLIIRDKVVSVNSREKPQKAARGNRRVRPMPKQQGRATADALLIFDRTENEPRRRNER